MRIYTLLIAAACAASCAAALPATVKFTEQNAGILTTARPAGHAAPAPADDEIIYYPPEGTWETLSRTCDAFTVEAWVATHSKAYGSMVYTVRTDDGEIYFYNTATEYPVQSWIKGTVTDDNTVVIEGAQPVYEEWNDYGDTAMVYIVPMRLVVDENMQGTYVATDDLRFVFNITDDGSLVSADPTMLLGVCTYGYTMASEEPDYVWSGYGDRDITISRVDASPVTPPTDAQIQKWVWSDPETNPTLVSVAIAGSDFYISGMNRDLPEAWIKGTLEGDKVTFPSGQYLGPDETIMYFCYFCGAEFSYVFDPETGTDVRYSSLADSSVFDYDAANKSIRSVNGYIINGSASELYPLYSYDDVTVEYQVRNPDCPPAAPYDLVYESGSYDNKVWVQIPNVDADGKLLDTDCLYYQVLVDGTPLSFTLADEEETETDLIPYAYQDYDIYVYGADHTVYFYETPLTSVGVRSVYVDENGKTLYSETITQSVDSAVDGTLSPRHIESEEWHDITGRRISAPSAGIAIRTLRYSDGSVSTRKVIVK